MTTALDEIRRRLDGYRSEADEIGGRIDALEQRRAIALAVADELVVVLELIDPDFAEVEGATGATAEPAPQEEPGRRSIRNEVREYLEQKGPAVASEIAAGLPAGPVRERQVEAALRYWEGKEVVRNDALGWHLPLLVDRDVGKAAAAEPAPQVVTVEPSREQAEEPPRNTDAAEEPPLPLPWPEQRQRIHYPAMPLSAGLRYMLEGYERVGATWPQLQSRGVPIEAIEGAVTAGEVEIGEWKGQQTYRLVPDQDEQVAAE